jgi:hypothetical protein
VTEEYEKERYRPTSYTHAVTLANSSDLLRIQKRRVSLLHQLLRPPGKSSSATSVWRAEEGGGEEGGGGRGGEGEEGKGGGRRERMREWERRERMREWERREGRGGRTGMRRG